MMKKILILLLVFINLALPFTISATTNKCEITDKIELLENLDMIEDVDEKLDEQITRRDFVIAVGKMLGINIYIMDETRYYKDMTSDDRAWNVANNLANRGILTVGESKEFRPDDIVTFHEAACITMRVLGVRNVEYATYYDIAVSSGILKGSATAKLTYRDAVEILYNTLNMNTFENLGKNGYKPQGKLLREILYDLSYTEGYVNAVNDTSLYGGVSYGLNTIVIGDRVINCNLVDPYLYLGSYVSAYYTDKNGVYTLENIFVKEHKTNKITVNADDFVGFDSVNYKAEYYSTGDNPKVIDIEKGASVIKNGDNDTSDIMGAFENIKNGEITFIDADKNNIYEFIIINSYENIVVRHIDKENLVIYGKYANIVDLSDETVPTMIFSATGEARTIEDIFENSVISYYASENLKKIVVSGNTVNGNITSVSKKHGHSVIKISGTEYKIDKVYMENSVVTLNSGSTVKALIDAYGKIADLEILQNAGTMYAWLVTKAEEKGMETILKLMLFTENSKLETVNVAKKVNVDGENYDSINGVIGALTQTETGVVDGQLVLVKKNSNGEITYVDTIKPNAVNERGLFVSSIEATNTFFGGQMLLGPEIRLNESSRLFIVPNNSKYKTDERAYKVVNGNKFFVSWKSYTITGYRNGDEDTVGYVDAMVLKRDLIGTGEKIDSGNIMIVKEIANVWDEADATVKAEVTLLNGASEEIYVCSEDYDALNDYRVQVGNIIRIATNPNGEMVDATLIYGEGKKETFKYSSWTNEHDIACGYIYDLRDGLMGLSLKLGEKPFTCLVTTKIPVIVYDSSLKENVYIGNEGELIEAHTMGYKVVVDMARGVTKSFIVIKELK